MPSVREDPYLDFNFLVEIAGLTVAGFSEADLPKGESRRSPTERARTRPPRRGCSPDGSKYGPLVTPQRIRGDATLFQWWHAVAQGSLDRRNVSVVLLDEQRQEVARWNLHRAWPSKYTGPSLNALGNDVAIETLELVARGHRARVS